VQANQRERIFLALESIMSAKGYADTSVADLIKEAGVSRQTFYELFTSKQDCFLASYGRRQGAVVETILEVPPGGTTAMDRFAALLQSYLAVMAADPPLARLYLIGVYTAGEEALAKRLEMQQQFVDGIVAVFAPTSEERRFACRALVSAISTLVTNALMEDDPQAVLDLYDPLLHVARKLVGSD
jgi:TetR/AcrR family transcriptional regulator